MADTLAMLTAAALVRLVERSCRAGSCGADGTGQRPGRAFQATRCDECPLDVVDDLADELQRQRKCPACDRAALTLDPPGRRICGACGWEAPAQEGAADG